MRKTAAVIYALTLIFICRQQLFAGSFDDSLSIDAAVRSDNIAAVKLLLDKGADINRKDKSGFFPMLLVNSLEMAQYLVERGARVD